MSHAPAAPAAAPAPAGAPAGPSKDPTVALAEEIYLRFMVKALTLNGAEPAINGNPDSYVRLAHKLAETFKKVAAEIKEVNTPAAKAFDLNAFDFESWNKTAAPAGTPAAPAPPAAAPK